MGFPDYTKDFKPINIHIRSVQDTESFVTGKNKAVDVQPFTGPDLIFSSNSSDIVFNHKFYTRLRLIDLADSNTTGFSSYSKPDNVENLDGKVVLTINQENTGEKNIWIRSILEKDIPSYLPNTRVGRSDGLSHKINLFGNETDLYVSDKDQKAGKTLVFDKLSGIKNIDAENINVSKNAVLQNTFTRQLVVSNNPDPDTYKTDDWHFIITDNNGKSDPSIDLKNIVLSTNKSIEIDEKNSYRDPSFNILNHGQDAERNPKRKNDIKLGDLEYFEGTARLAQQLESPIHLKVFSNDPTQKGKDGKPLVTIAGEVYLNGPSEATQSTGELPYFNLDLKNSYLFSSIVDNPNKNDEVVTRSKDKETTKEGARQFVTSISRKKDTSTAIQSDYDYIKFDDITERPSTLDGYGITDATTKDEFNKEVEERKQADEDIRKDVDKGLFKIVADNAINALNKYELLRINIEKLSNLYTNESALTDDTDILKSDIIGLAVIDEDIHGEFKNTVFKKCTTLKDAVDKVLSDYEKDGALTITRSTESAFVNKRHNSEGTSNVEYSVITDITSSTDKAKQLNAEQLLALNNQIADLLSECEHAQNELFTVLHLDTKRQLQYDIFNREPDPDDYIPGTARPLIDSFFDYTTAEVADDEDLKNEKSLLKFNNKGTDEHVITVESSVDLKGNFTDFNSLSEQDYSYEIVGRSKELFNIRISETTNHRDRKRTKITIGCNRNTQYIDNYSYGTDDESSSLDHLRYSNSIDGVDCSISYLKLIQNSSGKIIEIPLIVQAPDNLVGNKNHSGETQFYSPNLSKGPTKDEHILYILPDGTILPSQLSDNRLPDDPIDRVPNAIEDTFYDYTGDLINPDNNTKTEFDKFAASTRQKSVMMDQVDKTSISIVSIYDGSPKDWEVEKIEDIYAPFISSELRRPGQDPKGPIPIVIKEKDNKLRMNLNICQIQQPTYDGRDYISYYDRRLKQSDTHWVNNSISSKIGPILGADKNTYFNISQISRFHIQNSGPGNTGGDGPDVDVNIPGEIPTPLGGSGGSSGGDYVWYTHFNKKIFDSHFVYSLDNPKSGVINAISKFVPPTVPSMSGDPFNDMTCYPVCKVTLKQGNPSNNRITFTIRLVTGMVYKFAHATRPYAVQTRTSEQILKDLNSEEYTPYYTGNYDISALFVVKPLRRKDTKSKILENVLDYGDSTSKMFIGSTDPNKPYPKPTANGKFTHEQLRTNYSWEAQALSTLPTTKNVKTYDFNNQLASAEGTRLFNSRFGRTICCFNVTPPPDKKPFDIILDLYYDGIKLMPCPIYKNDSIEELADKIIDYNKLDIILDRSQKVADDSNEITKLISASDKDKLKRTIISNVINTYKDARFYYDFSSAEDDDLTATKKLSYETITTALDKRTYSPGTLMQYSTFSPLMDYPVIKRLRGVDDIDPDSDNVSDPAGPLIPGNMSDNIPGITVRMFGNGFYNEVTKQYEFAKEWRGMPRLENTHTICVITVDPTKLSAKKFTQTIDGKELTKTFCGFKLCLHTFNDVFNTINPPIPPTGDDPEISDDNKFRPQPDNEVLAYRNQSGFEFYFEDVSLFDTAPKELNFDADGGSADVNVTSLQGSRNLDWSIKNESEIPDWLTVNKQGNKLHVEAKPSE